MCIRIKKRKHLGAMNLYMKVNRPAVLYNINNDRDNDRKYRSLSFADDNGNLQRIMSDSINRNVSSKLFNSIKYSPKLNIGFRLCLDAQKIICHSLYKLNNAEENR